AALREAALPATPVPVHPPAAPASDRAAVVGGGRAVRHRRPLPAGGRRRSGGGGPGAGVGFPDPGGAAAGGPVAALHGAAVRPLRHRRDRPAPPDPAGTTAATQ